MVPLAFAVLLLVGVPVAIVLAATAMVYIGSSGSWVLFQSYPQQLYGGLEKYALLAIPLFMLVGELMNEGGITKRLIAFAGVFVGSLKGGLAYVNMGASMLAASIIGSANAQIAVMGSVMVPEMEKRGYDRAYAAAVTTAGGLLAPIFPPSMMFVIYGVMAQISIGNLFIAGIIPGLMMGGAFLAIIALLGFFYNYPAEQRMTRDEAIRAILNAIPALAIPGVIIGGILGGFATPTESAALAALAALLVGTFFYRDFDFRRVPKMLSRLVMNSSIVLFMVAAANVFGWIITFEKLPILLAGELQALTSDPFIFLMVMNLALLLICMFLDEIAVLILVVPLLLPIATANYGIDPYHFGVIICMNMVLGLVIPPVGTSLFVAAKVSGVKAGRIMKPLAPFIIATMAIMFLITWEPRLATTLIK